MKYSISLFSFLFVCIFLIFGNLNLHAITDDPPTNYQPELMHFLPSPEASSLGSYAFNPITSQNGLPDISIPIHEIKIKSVNIPITISYHAGGIKVNAVSSRVGLGWALNAGGLISRIVNGFTDEKIPGGYMYNNIDIDEIPNYSNEELASLFDNVVTERHYDLEPDLFFFNFNGYNGRFYIDKNKQVILTSRQDLKLEFFENNDGNKNQIIGWTVHTPDGNKYVFGKSLADPTKHATEKSINIQSNQQGAPLIYNSGWFLTYIVTIENDTITFNYDNETINYCQNPNQTYKGKYINNGDCLSDPSSNCDGNYSWNWNLSTTTVSGKRLSSILAPNQEVKFIYDNSLRMDLEGSNSLKKIIISEKSNEKLEWEFHHSYFHSSIENHGFICNFDDNNRIYRLKLDSLTKKKQDNSIPPYVFIYDSTPLPERLSNSVDHWGFHNGIDNGTRLIPNIHISAQNFTFIGADRNPRETHAQAGILKEIRFPTGGKRRFEYESNTLYGTSSLWGQESIPTELVILDFFGGEYFNPNNTAVPRVFVKDFRFPIINTPVPVKFHLHGTNCDLGLKDGCGFEIMIRNKNNPIDEFMIGGVIPRQVSWQMGPGEYEMIITRHDPTKTNIFNTRITASVLKHLIIPHDNSSDALVNIKAGGVRIKKIIDIPLDLSNSLIREYDYNYEGKSTGESNHIFRYHYTNSSVKQSGLTYFLDCCYINISSGNCINLSDLTSNPVSYTRVKEKISGGGTNLTGHGGETLFTYSYFAPTHSSSYPFFPSIDSPFMGGIPMTIQHYRTENFEKVSQINNDYKFYISDNQFGFEGKTIPGLVFGCRQFLRGAAGQNWCIDPIYKAYHIKSGISLQEKTTRTEYFSSTDSIFETTEYYYGNIKAHTNPTGMLKKNSNGDSLKFKYKYLFDFDINILNEAHMSLRERNAKSILIENLNWINEELTSGFFVGYELFENIPRKNNIRKISIPKPIQFSESFLPETLPELDYLYTTFNSSLPIYEVVHEFEKYDTHGNLLQEKIQKDGFSVVYLWGFNKSLPLAKIINTQYDELSIELKLKIEQLENFNGNLTPSQIKDLKDLNSEIRTIAMSGILITTYTYSPLFGMTSITDHRGISQFFEYDDLGRLVMTRNHDGEILQKLKYNYASPTY